MRARGRVYGVLLGAVFLAACTTSGTAVKLQATPSPVHRSPRPIDQVPAAEAQPWRDLGATIVPPDGFLKDVRVPSSTIVLNHTGGKVDDATARKWAEARLRVGAWEVWATENLQVGFLTPTLGPNGASSDVFGPDLVLIQRAQRDHGTLKITPSVGLHETQMTLVVVPQSVKDQVGAGRAIPADFAWVENQIGPLQTVETLPDGSTQIVDSVGPNVHITGATGGEFRPGSPQLGSIWYQDFQYNCSVDFLRAMCAS